MHKINKNKKKVKKFKQQKWRRKLKNNVLNF